jgi:hypothetical protein
VGLGDSIYYVKIRGEGWWMGQKDPEKLYWEREENWVGAVIYSK